MSTTNPNWPSSFTTTSVNASSIANGATATTAAISGNGKTATEVSVEILYGTPADVGAKVYVLRDVDGGTNYEAVADLPFGFEMAKSAGGTQRRTFTVDHLGVGKFKIIVVNDSGASITATVRYRQMTLDTA